MLRSTLIRWLAAGAALTAACSSKDNPPPLAYCVAQTCNPTTIISGSGTGGAGGGIDSGSNSLGVSMSVTMVGFTGSNTGPGAWSLASVTQLDGSFVVNVRTPDGSVLTQPGTNPISFSNVLATSDGWVSATPAANSGFLPAIRNIPSDSAGSVSVPLLHAVDFDFVSSLLSTALVVDSTKSQVVIKIIDVNGAGVAGLLVYSLGSQAMAYASGTSWEDSSTALGTDTSGRVVAINLPADPKVVTFVSVSARGLNLQGSVQTVSAAFPIQGGFVTYGALLFQ